jgi:hypothetical protein
MNLNVVWSAELPAETDTYANSVIDEGATLSCSSWEGVTATIDPETGQIIRKVFTK